jgi:hypothetical protein
VWYGRELVPRMLSRSPLIDGDSGQHLTGLIASFERLATGQLASFGKKVVCGLDGCSARRVVAVKLGAIFVSVVGIRASYVEVAAGLVVLR